MKKQKKPFHIIHYVEDSTSKMKKFTSISELNDFRLNFEHENKGKEFDGYWIDFIITDIHGKIIPVDEVWPVLE
jgi:hypothetical protein